MRRQKLSVVLFLLVSCPILVWALQSGIVGTVKDSSGAVLSGATITAKNVNTGETRQATTNEFGQYAIPDLKIGTYAVSAEKQGFQRKVVDQVVLEVQLTRTIDMALAPGTVAEQVNVTAEVTALQTTESSVGTLFETKVVNEIPLNGRNFLQLQLLSAGVTPGTGSVFQAVKIDAQSESIGGGNFSVNGAPDAYNDYIIDGISFKDWIHGTNGMNPSVDAIQEFRLQTSNYTADYGENAGGLVNMATKSGTNQFHGSAYEFIRNDKLDALDYFTKRDGGTSKSPLRRNQFGATLGGPIIHGKTFFFGSYDGFRQQSTSTLIGSAPTELMHHGDFSELLALSTPRQIHDPAGNPYPGNIIPEDQLLSVMPGYLDTYVPLPNRPGLVDNYVIPGTSRNSTNQYIARIDHSISNNIQLFGHYIYNQIHDNPPTINPNFFAVQHNGSHNVSLQLTDAISPNTVLELRAGYNLFRQYVNQNRQGTTPNIAADVLGINGVATTPLASDAPFFVTTDFGTGLGGNQPSSPRSWISERFEYQGDISLVRGKHVIRTGLQTVRHHETFPEIIIGSGEIIFDGTFTGYSMSDMLIGIPSQFLLSPEQFNPQFRQWEVMPWVQDDWRITPKLTVNLGLRYEYRPWPVSKDNSISNIVLPPGGGQASLILAGPCVPNLPVRPCQTSLPTSIAKNRSTFDGNDNNNFAPRIGFAYRLGNSGRSVVRGAYGIFYQPEVFSGLVGQSYNPPFVSFYDRFINTANYQNWDWFNPTAGLPVGGLSFQRYPGNSVNPYLQSWNLGVQHDLGAGFVLDVSYVGNHDTKLWTYTLPNQPHPGMGDIDARRPYTNVGSISSDEPIGNANYNGLQVKGEKRFSQGLSLLTTYTWSKAITDAQGSTSFAVDLQNNYDRAANRGLWNADIRHRFTVVSVYELPIGKNKRFLGGVNGVADKLISGWQVSGIGQFQTGQPLTATLSFDNPNVGEGSKLPNVVGDPNAGPKTVTEYFNTAAFAIPTQYTFGNEGIGAITGPGLSNVDLSLSKNTNITERVKVQFRAEAFNFLNHTILAAPNTTVDSSQFGRITGTKMSARQVQFALRFTF
jgi:hypothetical protein